MIRVLFFLLILPTAALAQSELLTYSIYNFSSSQLVYKHDKLNLPRQALDSMRFTNDLAAIRIDNKIGFANSKGTVVITPKYDTIINNWQNEMAVMGIKKGSRIVKGAINTAGVEVIPLKYKSIKEKASGEFITTSYTTWLVKDVKNTTLYGFEYDSVCPVAKGLYGIWVNKKLELQSMDGKQVLPPLYDNIKGLKSSNFLMLENNEKLGLADYSGKIILPVNYDSINIGKAGFIYVVKDNKQGLFNGNGQQILPCIYSSIKTPSENLIPVLGDRGRWGYVSFSNDTVLPFQYSNAESFKNDSATVGINGKLVVINKKREVVVPTQYFLQYHFGLYTREDSINCYVFPPRFNYRYSDAGKGYILVKNGKYKGVLNKKGKFIVPIDYDSVYAPSSDTVFLAINDSSIAAYDKYGNGRRVPRENIQKLYSLYDDRALILKDGRYGYLDNVGNIRISAQYTDARDFSDKRAAVVITGNWAFIDEQEKIKAQPYYSQVFPFKHGAARVKFEGKWTFLNKSGKEINSTWYDVIKPTIYGNYYLYYRKKVGLADSTGQEIIVPRYEQIEDLGHGFYKVVKEGKAGAVNSNADFVLPFEFDDIYFDSINNVFLCLLKEREELIKVGPGKSKK